MLLLLLLVSGTHAFVEEVGCQSESMRVVLNRTDAVLQRWMQDPNSQPVAYVYGFKERARCGIALKGLNGLPNYNLTVPYGPACGLDLTDLEPNYQTAETTIALEDNNDNNEAKPMRINHVFCLYTRRVHTMKFKDISTGHQVVASTGGKPKPKVEMVFKTKDGKPIRAAKFGDEISFFLAIDPDNAYKAIMPRKCLFSDKETMEEAGAQKLTFVQSHCPVEELSEIISPLEDLNEQVYRSNFRTFRFGNKSTLYAHCTVEVCLDQRDCQKTCFKHFTEAPVLNGTSANEDLQVLRPVQARFRNRFRRDEPGLEHEKNEVAVSQTLTILDQEETQEVWGPALESSLSGPGGGVGRAGPESCLLAGSLGFFHLLLIVLGAALFVSMTTAICLANKLRKQTRDLEARALVNASPSIMSAYAGPYTLPRTIHHQIGGEAVDGDESLPDSNRSVSEMTVTHARPAWIHSIPRVHTDKHSFY